jgi:hypothetical protein
LALEYLHVIFPLKVRSHPAESELPYATEINSSHVFSSDAMWIGNVMKAGVRFDFSLT